MKHDNYESKISQEMLQAIEKIPKTSARKIEWTPEKEEIILKYWKCRRQRDIAQLLNISPRACADKWIELTKDKKNT